MLWQQALKYWKTIVIGGAILYLSLIKEPVIPLPDISAADKWSHMLAYIALSGTWMGELLADKGKSRLMQLWLLALILPVVFGGVIEVLQYFDPPRSAEWLDWLADILGSFIGAPIAYLLWNQIHCSTK